MKRLLSVFGLLTLAAAASAETLFLINFDNGTVGPWSSGTYTLGAGEIAANVTGGASDPGVVPVPNGLVAPNNPEFQLVSAITANNTPVQAGKALVLSGTSTPDGAYIDFGAAFAPPDVKNVTVEVTFLVKTLPVPGNTADISNIFSTEWPGGTLSWNIRTLGTSLQLVVSNTDGERQVTATGLTTNRWYHVAGVLALNEATPANSTIELFLDGVSKGTNTIDLSGGKYIWFLGNQHTTRGSMISLGVNAGNAEGYWATDDRGLDGAISAVAVTNEVRNPSNFVLTTVPTAATDWAIFE